jgi:hypothetical protein
MAYEGAHTLPHLASITEIYDHQLANIRTTKHPIHWERLMRFTRTRTSILNFVSLDGLVNLAYLNVFAT